MIHLTLYIIAKSLTSPQMLAVHDGRTRRWSLLLEQSHQLVHPVICLIGLCQLNKTYSEYENIVSAEEREHCAMGYK